MYDNIILTYFQLFWLQENEVLDVFFGKLLLLINIRGQK